MSIEDISSTNDSSQNHSVPAYHRKDKGKKEASKKLHLFLFFTFSSFPPLPDAITLASERWKLSSPTHSATSERV